MNNIAPAELVPTAPGTPFQGGFYAGRFRVHDEVFALIVSPKAGGELADQAWAGINVDVPGTESFCDGLGNTLAMAEGDSTLAKAITALDINGFTDWYLPSRDELELLYRNLKPTTQQNYTHRHGENPSSLPAGYPYTPALPVQTPAPDFHDGGVQAFAGEWYWSSTQFSRYYAWDQYFSDGNQVFNDKSFEGPARAVRRFKVQ